MKTIAIKTVLVTCLLMVLPFATLLAGPSSPGFSPTGTPIDGGISLLVAAGIGYGAKKVKDARKKHQKQEGGITEK